MPNHVTHICTVTGPSADVAAFVEAHIRPDEPDKRVGFLFDTIIPRPKSIEGTTSGREQELGMLAILFSWLERQWPHPEGDPVYVAIRKRFSEHRFIPRSALVDSVALWKYLDKSAPRARAEGGKSLVALGECGFADWYEWCLHNWGTKWGAYDFEERERGDGRYVFKFETAWSFPTPIFEKLRERWPSLTFGMLSFDEGWNFACEGEIGGRNDFAKVEATKELYERVYGEKYEEGES